MKLKPIRLLRFILLTLVTALAICLFWFVWPIIPIVLAITSAIGFFVLMTPIAYKPSLPLKAFKKIVAFFNNPEVKSSMIEKLEKNHSGSINHNQTNELSITTNSTADKENPLLNKDIISKCREKFPAQSVLIGKGGCSKISIVKVTNKDHSLTVAIKHVRWKNKQTDKKRKNYLYLKNEKNLLNQLDHENIITTYGDFEGNNYFCLVMPLMDTCLHKLIEETKNPFDQEAIAHMIRSILCGLKYLHEANLVHRDIKPENVLVKRSKNVYRFFLADFGLAETGNCITNNFAGTLPWVSPELYTHFFAGKKNWMLTGKDDIYAVALIAYCLCAGLTEPCENTPKLCSEQFKVASSNKFFAPLILEGQKPMAQRPNATEMLAMIPSFN